MISSVLSPVTSSGLTIDFVDAITSFVFSVKPVVKAFSCFIVEMYVVAEAMKMNSFVYDSRLHSSIKINNINCWKIY